MNCPACHTAALEEHEPACRACGFSLERLAQTMGIPPVLTGPVADLTRSLTGRDRRAQLRGIHALHQRFPQLSFAAVLADLDPSVPMSVHAFWLFNKGSLFSAVERGGDCHGVLFLVDVPRLQAITMIGYGLEPFVSEMHLEVCLTAASASVKSGQFGAAIGAFVRELERQLLPLTEKLPGIFGYEEEGGWTESGADVAAVDTSRFGPASDDMY